ncbi:MAG: carbohydrate ABC transporter permease [Eubacteriales bacterium]|nr:carbohydrate ABC transporter permease [Eubacteriales bacterium]
MNNKNNRLRKGLLVYGYCVAVVVLAVISVVNSGVPAWERLGNGLLSGLWLALLAEQLLRVLAMSPAERQLYWKAERLEILFFLLSAVILPASWLGHWQGARWVLLLKLPQVLHCTNDENAFQFIANLLVAALIAVFVCPFLQVISVAISQPGAVINLLPEKLDMWGVNYVLHDRNFFKSIGISVLVTLIGTAISVVSMTMAAYPLSKKELPFRRTMMVFFLIVMLFNGGMAPNILLMNSLGLTNTIWALILPSVVMVFHLLLLKGFFEGIPPELEESAKIDGANNYTILFRIIVPVAAPMIATVAFFTAIAYWNNINNSILYITSNQSIYPLPMYIKNFLSTNPVDIANANPLLLTYWDNVKMSYILISILPVLIVYPFIFRYIKNGVTMGAVKG